jgi:protein-disulfide isomerase
MISGMRMRWVVAAALLAACRQGNTDAKLDELLARVQDLHERQVALAERIEKIERSTASLDQILRAAVGAEAAPDEEEEPRRPDGATVFSVPIDGAPVRGSRTAKVTIVEGAEFACPFCLKVRPTLAEIEKAYGKDVRIVRRSFVVHPQYATDAALAACAAHKQGKFWEMDDAIWSAVWDADTLQVEDASYLEEDGLIELAGKLKLDTKKFAEDMKGTACRAQINDERAQLARVGARGTPTFYINGRYLSGALPLSSFKKVIDEELAKATAAVKGGIKADRYYDTIVASGVKEFEP